MSDRAIRDGHRVLPAPADVPEAISSGAFWFYDRMGFRPTDAALTAVLAARSATISNAG